MVNMIAEHIRREIERDQRRKLEEMQAQLAADLCARDQYVPSVPPTSPKKPTMTKPPKKYERVGRFYLIKHTGYWGRVRIDGDGTEYSHRTKKEATETAWRVTTREGETERRAERKAEQEAQHLRSF